MLHCTEPLIILLLSQYDLDNAGTGPIDVDVAPVPAHYSKSVDDADVDDDEKDIKQQTIIIYESRPQWLNWMHRLTGDQEVAGSTPAEVGNILSWRLIMKYFLQSFSPFRWFKKGSCQFLAKECAQYWLTS